MVTVEMATSEPASPPEPKQVVIFCSGCGQRGPSSCDDVEEAQRAARDEGWLVVSTQDVDLCPTCVQQAAQKD
jgi:hypothetical protein